MSAACCAACSLLDSSVFLTFLCRDSRCQCYNIGWLVRLCNLWSATKVLRTKSTWVWRVLGLCLETWVDGLVLGLPAKVSVLSECCISTRLYSKSDWQSKGVDLLGGAKFLLEEGPLKCSQGSRERCKLPKWGMGRSPSQNRILYIFTPKIWH